MYIYTNLCNFFFFRIITHEIRETKIDNHQDEEIAFQKEEIEKCIENTDVNSNRDVRIEFILFKIYFQLDKKIYFHYLLILLVYRYNEHRAIRCTVLYQH